jgi:hypothetical protein
MIEGPLPTPFHRRIGGVRRLFAILALGVAACSPWTTRPCLRSDTVETRFIRKRWGEATDPTGSWKTRICATEDVITYNNGESADRPDAPACTEETLDRLEAEIFRRSPVANNRLQLARIYGISDADATRSLMPTKADVLLRLAALRPEDIGDYELTPGERGPPLDKMTFHRLALRGLADSHLAFNQEAVGAAVLARRRLGGDAIERRLLEAVTATCFEDEPQLRHPSVAAHNERFALFDQVMAETTAALDRDYDEVEHGLILDHLELVALYAKLFGRELPASRLFRNIVDREARFTSVRGKPAARRDLYVAARMAEAECHLRYEAPSPWRWYEEPPRTLDELVFDPALYERGFDCRGKSEPQLALSGLLERLAQGTLSPGPKLSHDGAALLLLLPMQPEQATARPDVRALVLSHPRELQAQQTFLYYDVLRPVFLAIAASEPGDPTVRAFLQSYLVVFREQPPARAREILLVARLAKGFGLEAEVRAQADDLAAHAVKGSSPALDAVISEGVRASIDAATLEPW